MARQQLPDDVVQLAKALESRLDETVDRLTASIRKLPPYRSGVVDEADVRRALHTNLAYLIDALQHSEPLDLAAPRETGRLRGHSGAPLPELLHAYRMGFAELWRLLVEEARRSPDTAYESLIDAATEIWSLGDEYSVAVTDAYREASSDRVLANAKERAALIDVVLTGETTDDATLWEIAERLRLPFDGVFVVAIAQTRVIGEDPLPGIESRLAARDIASAWRLTSSAEVGLLSCGNTTRLASVLDVLTDLAATRVGVSPSFETLRTAPDALRFARLAMASIPAASAAVRQFDATPIATVTAANPESARQVARTVLGDVLTLPAAERDTLLETFEAWLDALGSARDAGRQLYVHANTVRHRLKRIEHFTGRDLANPREVAELAIAVQAVRLFPDLAP